MAVKINDLREDLLKHYQGIPLETLQNELNEIARKLTIESYSFELDFNDESLCLFSDMQVVSLKGAA